MPKVAVFSDSHGDISHLPSLQAKLGQVDWLVHAGDHIWDAAGIAAQLSIPSQRVRTVVGNCDDPYRKPVQEVFELSGYRVLVTHGHLYAVKTTLDRLYYRAKEVGAALVIFGHSHVPLAVLESDVLLFNPGSLTQPRLPGAMPSCGLIEIGENGIQAHHLYAG